jgi:hypothetical protein
MVPDVQERLLLLLQLPWQPGHWHSIKRNTARVALGGYETDHNRSTRDRVHRCGRNEFVCTPRHLCRRRQRLSNWVSDPRRRHNLDRLRQRRNGRYGWHAGSLRNNCVPSAPAWVVLGCLLHAERPDDSANDAYLQRIFDDRPDSGRNVHPSHRFANIGFGYTGVTTGALTT